MNITDEIKKFICEYAKKEVEEITENTKMIAELGIDSLTFVRMVNDAENNFDVTIPDDKLIAVKTVGDFVKLLQN